MKSPFQLNLKTSQTWLLGVTGALLALVLVVRFLYLPVIARIGERRATLTDFRVKIADAQGLAQQLPDQEKMLQRARERSSTLESRIAEGQSVARILELLSARAKDHRLELVAVQPRAEHNEPRILILGPEVTLREIPLNLRLTGRYRQVGEFLGELPTAPFLASVHTLVLTKPQADTTQLTADLALAVYLAERSPAR